MRFLRFLRLLVLVVAGAFGASALVFLAPALLLALVCASLVIAVSR